ncbi:MAG TPA: hypothetical protein VHP38_06650 [Ruminiclostridium sp.]|nr:hypothetical protein [Ruminiclostridium sp.]
MGKIAAVCSEVKNSGKSVFTYILANQVQEMLSKDAKILVCCLNSKFSLLYKLFGVSESAPGMEELINFEYSGCERDGLFTDVIPKGGGFTFSEVSGLQIPLPIRISGAFPDCLMSLGIAMTWLYLILYPVRKMF